MSVWHDDDPAGEKADFCMTPLDHDNDHLPEVSIKNFESFSKDGDFMLCTFKEKALHALPTISDVTTSILNSYYQVFSLQINDQRIHKIDWTIL